MRRVNIESLMPGMFVVSVERQTGDLVLKSEGVVRDARAVDALRKRGVQEVIVDPARSHAGAFDHLDSKPEIAPVKSREEQGIERLEPKVSFEAEIGKANQLYKEAKSLQQKAFDNIRAGRPIEVGPMQDLAGGIMQSIFRNKDALLCVSRMREKDAYLLEHSVNVSLLMTIFARYLGFDDSQIHELSTGALLHDIGKILVPDAVLNKPGKLTAEEYDVMKRHVNYGVEVLKASPGVSTAMIETIGQHHERLSGNGYPNQLKDAQISQAGRMIAIVDTYDAITATRVYKEGEQSIKAFKILRDESGTAYDADLVTDFVRAIGIHPVGTLVKLNSQKLGLIVKSNLAKPTQPVVKVFYNVKFRQHIPIAEIDLSDPRQQDAIEASVKPEQFKVDLLSFFKNSVTAGS